MSIPTWTGDAWREVERSDVEVTTTLEGELAALRTIADTLSWLDPKARGRVLEWALSKHLAGGWEPPAHSADLEPSEPAPP